MRITAILLTPFVLCVLGYWIAFWLGHAKSRDVEFVTTVFSPVIIIGGALFFRQWRAGVW